MSTTHREVVSAAREAMNRGATMDEVIGLLRERGLSKTESLAFLEDELGVPHPDAKRALHISTAWASERAAAEDLEKRLLDSEMI